MSDAITQRANIDKKSLSELSAQEINMRVANVKFPDAKNIEPSPYSDSAFVTFNNPEKDFMIEWVDCDALAFRLMVDNHIDHYYDHFEDEYVTEKQIPSVNGADLILVASSRDEDLGRAACECYLLMNGVGK